MQDPSGRYSLVFNGEIYNFNELREALEANGFYFRSRSDTEVILQGFVQWGVKVFPKLHGMFALAIYDAHTEKVFLARDRLGIKPMIYSLTPSQFVFASELKVLHQHELVSDELDSVSLMSLLRFGSASQPRTILRGVQNLSPGHFMVVESNGSHQQEPFCLPLKSVIQPRELDYYRTVALLRKKLETATRLNLVADVEVGCFLSGGIDSTAVLALMQREVSQPIQAFSLGFSRQQEVEDESLIAERSAKALGAKFHRVIIQDEMVPEYFSGFLKAIDQPSIDGFNTYLISQAASQHVKISLSGLGGDELFGGYPHFSLLADLSEKRVKPWDRIARLIQENRPNRYTYKLNLRGRNVVQGLHQIRNVYSKREIKQMLKNTVEFSYPEYSITSLSPLQNITLAEFTGYLRNTLLRDTDALSMWHGLEIRPVLLDQNILEFVLGLPDNFKIRQGRYKAVFVDSVRDILPPEVLQRPKSGFELPYAYWMNGVLRSQMLALWESESARSIFQATFLKSLIKRTQSNNLCRRDWLLAVLVGWAELQLK